MANGSLNRLAITRAGRGRKLIGSKRINLIVGWCGQFLFFVVSFVGEWPENQILIPDWTYFHCPDTSTITFPEFHNLKGIWNRPKDLYLDL